MGSSNASSTIGILIFAEVAPAGIASRRSCRRSRRGEDAVWSIVWYCTKTSLADAGVSVTLKSNDFWLSGPETSAMFS